MKPRLLINIIFSFYYGGGGGDEAPHRNYRNFAILAPMSMKFGTDIKLDVFCKMETKKL